ncbi:MAG: hypothetical protein ACREN6_00370 [Gemmatimonadaceae bacterium]
MTEIDMSSGKTIRRFVPHVFGSHDTTGFLDFGVRRTDWNTELLLLDGRGRRLIDAPTARAANGAQLRAFDLRGVLNKSDNPIGVGVASWGVAVSGTMMNGTVLAFSADAVHWAAWRDTTPVVDGMPLESFMRSLAATTMVLLHPSKRIALLPGKFQESMTIVDIGARTSRQVTIDSLLAPPARFRMASDSGVRISWRPDARLHFLAGAASRSFVALVDCDCSFDGDPGQNARRIWLIDWDGVAIARFRAPVPVIGITITADERQLVAIVQDGPWQHLVAWSIPYSIVARAGRGHRN